MGRAAAPLNHGAAAPQHHAQAAGHRACIRCGWFARLGGPNKRDRKIEGGGGAWALEVAAILKINTTQQSNKIAVGDGGEVREESGWGGTHGGVPC